MIDINIDTRTLRIFDRFQIDRNLPKFKKKQPQVIANESGFIVNNISQNISIQSNFTWNQGQTRFMDSSQAIALQMGREMLNKKRRGLYGRFAEWLSSFVYKKKDKAQDALVAFEVVFSSAQSLKIFQDRQQAFDILIKDAQDNGQQALVQSLTEQRNLRIRQNQLFATGFNTFISQKALVDVAVVSQKGLRLDWIKNFTRHLPKQAIQKKRQADALKVFDNYVILHYDPENKSNKLTKEQLEKKKDPILFGVMSNSRKLYFIADWIDQKCDLTFEQLLGIATKNNVLVGETKIV